MLHQHRYITSVCNLCTHREAGRGYKSAAPGSPSQSAWSSRLAPGLGRDAVLRGIHRLEGDRAGTPLCTHMLVYIYTHTCTRTHTYTQRKIKLDLAVLTFFSPSTSNTINKVLGNLQSTIRAAIYVCFYTAILPSCHCRIEVVARCSIHGISLLSRPGELLKRPEAVMTWSPAPGSCQAQELLSCRICKEVPWVHRATAFGLEGVCGEALLQNSPLLFSRPS